MSRSGSFSRSGCPAAFSTPSSAGARRSSHGSERRRSERSGDRRVQRDHLHVTLAFLGARPARELPEILDALRSAAAAAAPFPLEPSGYRETRSVGMVVLRDPTGGAARLAARPPRPARADRRLPPRGAELAAACHGAPLPRPPAAAARLHLRSAPSLRPTPLLSFHVCTRPERGTRCSVQSRSAVQPSSPGGSAGLPETPAEMQCSRGNEARNDARSAREMERMR